LAPWARDVACEFLAEQLPRRWAHTQGVAAQAEALAPMLGDDADLVQAAAWLHDVGYSPTLAETGFHPLDGARFLRDVHGADERLCRLVAHHSCAEVEADMRSLRDVLVSEFPAGPDRLDALTYCDMTTGPSGDRVTVTARLDEILDRYGREHPVGRAMRTASPDLLAMVTRIERLRTAG
jgi:putative nucleotidyltransferase with HDIG domain